MSALPPIATAKADIRKTSCLLYPQSGHVQCDGSCLLWANSGQQSACIALGFARIKQKQPQSENRCGRQNEDHHFKCAVAAVGRKAKVTLNEIQHGVCSGKPE